MLPERWDRIQSVFLRLAELPPREQARELDTECGTDTELRAEVESLLASDRAGLEALSESINLEASLLVAGQNLVGDRLGSWRIVKEIGRGGMGTVYLAARADDQFQKQVAIKVVRHGMDTVDVLERFRHERQILANLDHPYIARLLDGGTTPDGRPFFVMDYVEGKPLDRFCAENNLDIEARCHLFLRILEAVSHAHRNLVVHRDLKPANIFVRSDGSPKLLDFGVAKLLDTDAGAALTMTMLGRPFTPEYASPEQVQGAPVTTSVDIYSLGAVFFEMLTGKRAQPIESHTPSEVERVICHNQISRPSVWARGLDADLDNIVLMAMRKEPARRYQSVDRLAEDIHRYMNGQTVLARQDSFWYRARKFSGRNRFAITAAGLVLASLVTALAVTLAEERVAQTARRVAEAERGISDRERVRAEAGYRQAEMARAAEAQQRLNADRQRDEAVRERARAERSLNQLLDIADKTLFDIHDVVARLPGATEARRVMVKTTLDYLERVQTENALDDRLRLALGAGYSRIAAIQGDPFRSSLGNVKSARDSFLRAEALLSPVYARKKDDPDVIMHWLEVETGLAGLSFAESRSPKAIQAYVNLVPAAHRLAELAPLNLQAAKQEAKIEGALCMALQPTDSRAAIAHGNRQIAILTTLIGRFPADRDLQHDLGSSLADAAVPLTDLGDYTRAAEFFERSIPMLEEVLQGEPYNAQTQRSLAEASANYCSLLGIPWSANMGRPSEARIYCGKSAAMARELSSADPRDQTARFDLGVSLGRLGMIEPDPEKVADSLKTLEESLDILGPIIRANPSSAEIVFRVVQVRQYAGLRLQSLGRLDAAAGYFHQALTELDTMRNAKPGQPSGTAATLGNEEGLAEIYATRGDRDGALTYAGKAVERAQKYAASHPGGAPGIGHLGEAFFELAWVERTLKEWDRAAADVERALSLWRSIGDEGVLSIHRQARQRADALVREIAAQRAQ